MLLRSTRARARQGLFPAGCPSAGRTQAQTLSDAGGSLTSYPSVTKHAEDWACPTLTPGDQPWVSYLSRGSFPTGEPAAASTCSGRRRAVLTLALFQRAPVESTVVAISGY